MRKMEFEDLNDESETDFDDELAAFDREDDDEFDDEFEPGMEIEITNVRRRIAVLSKREMIAILGVQTFDQGGTICRVDPREERPAVQLYDNPAEALDWFKRSLRTSRKNGWQVVYDGLPLHG